MRIKNIIFFLFSILALAKAAYAESVYLQTGAYTSTAQAETHQRRLSEQGWKPNRIHSKTTQGKTFYEVQIGPLDTPEDIHKMQQALQRAKIPYLLQHETTAATPVNTSVVPPAPDQALRTNLPAPKKASPPSAHFEEKPSAATTAPQTPAKQALHPTHAEAEHAQLWNLRNTDIRSVIEEVSRETGKNFIVDPRVQGKISIVSSTPINARAVYQMFLAALNVLGYSAISSGHVIKIVPSIAVNALAPPLETREQTLQGDEPIVRVVAVKNVSAIQLVPLLRPLLPDWGNMVAYGPSNVLILAGNANAVNRAAEIIKRVDTTNADGIDVIPLHYATAQELVQTIQALQSNNDALRSTVNVAAANQSNTILISGAESARLKMRVLISELDTPSASGSSGNTQVVYLHYLKARDLVPILAGIAKSYGSSVGTVIGTITEQKTYTPIDGQQDSFSDSGSDSSLASLAPPASNTQAQQAVTSQSQGEANKPRVEIIGEPNTNSIIINAPPTLMRTLKSVIAQLDIRPAQVLVEALIAEVDASVSQELGIQWGTVASPDDANSAGNSTSSAIFQQGIGIVTKHGVKDIQAVIRALENDKDADILSTPSIVVLDNHQAQIFVGTERSIESSAYLNNNNQNGTGTPYTLYSREQVGLHLYVTPSISQDNTIQMLIDQGDAEPQNPESSTTTPIINKSAIKTSVLVNNGDILVLGGLIQNQLSSSNSKIPILGDIPVLGNLFNVQGHGQGKKVLMAFIRPIVVHNQNTSVNVTGSKYNFVRSEQLSWLQQQQYVDGINDHALPDIGKPIHLPQPFSE